MNSGRATLQRAQGAAFGIEDESGLVLADTAALRAKGVRPEVEVFELLEGVTHVGERYCDRDCVAQLVFDSECEQLG